MKNVFFPLMLLFIFSSCVSHDLKEPYKSNFTTSGALTDDCFQVIITTPPDKNLKIMADQRENSLMKAKNIIKDETEKQIISYYLSSKSINNDNLTEDKSNIIKIKALKYVEYGKIEHEYFLIDNSVVIIFRIF